MHPYLSAPRPHLFGHRGSSGEAPENTRMAFARALAQGMGFLEMDCHATRDGEVVIIHDPVVDRVTDGSGPVKELRSSEVARLDAGYRFTRDGLGFPCRGRGLRIPRLAEILEAFPSARINLEVKQAEPPIAERVVRIVCSAGAGTRVLLAAEKDEVMHELHRLRTGTAFGSSFADALAFFQALDEGRLDSFRPRGDALQIPAELAGRPLVTAASVAAAHRVGLALHVWTINDPGEMHRLLALGVDGIMTDFPDRLRRVAAQRAGAAGPSARRPPRLDPGRR